MEKDFWGIFIELCDERDVTPHAVMKELNLNTGNPTAWKNGRVPGASTLGKLASYFDCQIDYLLGNQEERIKTVSPAPEGTGLTEEELSFITALRSLSESERRLIYRQITALAREK